MKLERVKLERYWKQASVDYVKRQRRCARMVQEVHEVAGEDVDR